jgi:glycine/D-amino acid oxidase-like deaminating enzyme/nitrite reductase/ring-hydroxylating ferredoxin subunit
MKSMNTNFSETSGQNTSSWFRENAALDFKPLERDLETDVVIVGAGIAGVSCAYLLSEEGKRVVLIDDGQVGSGETGRTTAHITHALDDRYYELEKIFDAATAKLAAQSHTAAINRICEIVEKENISCDLSRLPGYLFLHPTDKETSLRDEFMATHRAGITTQFLKKTPGFTDVQSPALCFPAQAQFHPLKYLEGLCRKIRANDGLIFTGTHAAEIMDGRVTTADGFKIDATDIIIATNTPVNNRFVIHTKQHAYRSYVIAGKIAKDVLPPALWWDTGDQHSEWTTCPYHYVRLQEYDETHDLLIVGGEDHKTGQEDEDHKTAEERYAHLEEWARKYFPAMEDVVYRWSGQVMEPVDCLAYIGRNPNDSEHIYIATGDSGNGMTHGTIAGILITDLICGRKNPWEKIYSPARITLSTSRDYITENINTIRQYADFLTPGDMDEINELGTSAGAVIRKGVSKVAAYKDEKNHVHLFSAICPHLGCVVAWNSDEKTFDCPCHGSRFSCMGKVLNGPANQDLGEIGGKEP